MPAPTPEIIQRLKDAAGDEGWIEDAELKQAYLNDERGLYHGEAALVLRPGDTETVAAMVKICAEGGVGIVPQGGNTGYCGGSVPSTGGGEIVLSLGRMNKIRALDALNHTMTVDAGCVLANIQTAADEAGLLFPLSLAAEGSCQIGGNLSTNAGGVQVLRYGNARDLVFGLEVVLADGRILDGLRGLRKDNSGYDLKHLFMGAEGTLGIITGAVLKLYPKAAQTVTLLTALAGGEAAVQLLSKLRAASGDTVTTFEYINRESLELVLDHMDATRDPFQAPHPAYALIEVSSSDEGGGKIRQQVEVALADALENGGVLDAVFAESGQQMQDLWRLRETIPEAQKRAGGAIKLDVSVPVSKIPEFLGLAAAAVRQTEPDARLITFGHMGDGNIHFNLTQPVGAEAEAFAALSGAICPAIHDIAVNLGGSFSAEHGIGVLKKPELARYKSDVELDMMRTIKAAIDPGGIMNPGKVIGD